MIKFINLFEVPEGRDEEFLAVWGEVNEYMRAKPGYVSHRLHRSTDPTARYRYVNYVEWESAEHWAAAHDDGFRVHAAKVYAAGFTSTPALYDVVHEANATDGVVAGLAAAAPVT
jgi:heme-degrading monooxygenase HmoA